MIPPRILVVDDDEDILLLITTLLKANGYAVTAGRDVTAVYEIEKDPPALLLIDNWLSGKTGHDICLHLKQDPRTASIPVVLISATSRLGETAQRCGADDYICKPFEVKELLEKVRLYAGSK